MRPIYTSANLALETNKDGHGHGSIHVRSNSQTGKRIQAAVSNPSPSDLLLIDTHPAQDHVLNTTDLHPHVNKDFLYEAYRKCAKKTIDWQRLPDSGS